MTNDDGRKPEGAPERSPKAGGAPSGVDGNGPKRFSVQRKMAIVARLLRGEPRVFLVSALALIANPIVLMRFAFHLGNHFDFSNYAPSHRSTPARPNTPRN
jgi:hypothetical protein